MTNSTLDRFAYHRVVPIIVIDDAERASELGDALAAGGIGIAEVTLRTPGGEAAMRALAARDDFLVGAGTVTTVEQVERAAGAGAKFVVSPGFDPVIVRRCQDLDMAPLPGIATATELQAAIAMGLDAVKLFPAHILGGLDLVDAFSAPFPSVRFMPSGGVTFDTFARYLAHPSVFAIGASWIASRAAISQGDFVGICERAKATLRSGGVADAE